MSKTEIPEDIAALARKVGRQFKSEQDLADFSRLLKKITVEAALGGEIEDHLGYSKHEVRGRGTGNSRNGYSRKTLKGDHGAVEIDTPRDRNGTFEPQIVRKGQTRVSDRPNGATDDRRNGATEKWLKSDLGRVAIMVSTACF